MKLKAVDICINREKAFNTVKRFIDTVLNNLLLSVKTTNNKIC